MGVLLIAITLLAALLGCGAEPAPHAAIVRAAFVWDGQCDYCEGPVVLCRTTSVRARPEPGAATVFTAQQGDSLELIHEGLRIYTDVPDTLIFTKSYRDPSSGITFQPGDTVLIYVYGWEGLDGAWRYQGTVHTAENAWMHAENIPGRHDGTGAVARNSNTLQDRRWIRVRDRAGSEGWLEDTPSVAVHPNYYERELPPCAQR